MKKELEELLEELMYQIGQHTIFTFERCAGDSTQVMIFDRDDRGALVMVIGLIKWDDWDKIVTITDTLHRPEVADTLFQLEKYDEEVKLNYSSEWRRFY